MSGEKLADKIAAFQASHPGQPFFSVEFFPPKTDDGVKNLEARFDRFQQMGERVEREREKERER